MGRAADDAGPAAADRALETDGAERASRNIELGVAGRGDGMHELSLTQAVVDLCSEAAGGARVRRVTIEVGTLSGVVPDALRFCYEICTAGTLLESSELDIVEEPGHAACRICGERFALADMFAACACGSYDLSISGGQTLRVKAMEVT